MKTFRQIVITIFFVALFSLNVYATGGNITGYKDKNSDKITLYNGKYYGYHNENGVRHYHELEWNEVNQRWQILKPAVYYDAHFNIIDRFNDEDSEKFEVKFVETVDGDTADFELNGEVIRVRFLGINTRETVAPNKPVEAWGKAASDFTKNALQNANKIEIEYDKSANKKDKYDRHLTWIWVDGKLLQEELVLQGLAEQYMLQTNYRYADVLQEAESIAKSEKIGIWSENEYIENNENASQNGTNIKENKLDIDNKTLIFIAILIIGIIAITLKNVKNKN